MSWLLACGDTAASLFGLVVLVLMVFSIVGALYLWALAAARFVRNRRQKRRLRAAARRKYTTEAIEEALRDLGQQYRESRHDAMTESRLKAYVDGELRAACDRETVEGVVTEDGRDGAFIARRNAPWRPRG